LTVPLPTLSDDATTSSMPNHSIAYTAPTMSMIESSAPTSWQVHLIERHAVDGRLGFTQAVKQLDRTSLPRRRQRRVANQMRDLVERPVPFG
jgi:hypothetical protein